ncbi:MAG: ATP-dependent metallopeptidase FtsH/Yme1/Tma family protein, partial [Pirellulaceae bacterium]
MAETPRPEDKQKENTPGGGGMRPNFMMITLVIIIAVVMLTLFNSVPSPRTTIEMSRFREQVVAGNVLRVKLGESTADGEFREKIALREVKDGKFVEKTDKDGSPVMSHKEFSTVIPPHNSPAFESLVGLLEAHDVSYNLDVSTRMFQSVLYFIIILLPLVIFLLIWNSFRRSRDQMMGGGFLSGFSKSPAK